MIFKIYRDEVKRHQRTTDDTYGLKGLDTISASGISRADAAESREK